MASTKTYLGGPRPAASAGRVRSRDRRSPRRVQCCQSLPVTAVLLKALSALTGCAVPCSSKNYAVIIVRSTATLKAAVHNVAMKVEGTNVLSGTAAQSPISQWSIIAMLVIRVIGGGAMVALLDTQKDANGMSESEQVLKVNCIMVIFL